MALSAKYKSSLTHQDLDIYNAKVETCAGIYPNELVESGCSDVVKLWPKINELRCSPANPDMR